MTSTASPKPDYKVVGTNPTRQDGVDKVTGRALYGADMNLPGMIYGKILRSPHAHARVLSIDTSKAEAHPDVRAIATFKDFPDPGSVKQENAMGVSLSENLLANDKVYYKGHAIVAVAATSVHAAEDALALIDVQYEVLPSVSTVEESLAQGAPILHDNWEEKGGVGGAPLSKNIAVHEQYISGDVDKGFAEADTVLEREYRTKSVHQGYIEPHTATCWWSQDGRVTIWCSSQGHFGVRDRTSRVLGIPVSDIKVAAMEIGGGFGGKNPIYLEPVVAVLSKKSGLPVKITMTRAEVLEASGPTSGGHLKVKVGVTNGGKITTAQAYYAFEGGAYPGAPLSGAAAAMFSPYVIDNVRIDAFDVMTNKPKTEAYRAPGAPIVCYAAESMMDEISSEIGMEPMEFRLNNVATEGTRRADGAMNGPIGAKEVMEATRDHDHYNSPLPQLEGKLVGRGVGMGFCRNNSGMSSAIANVMSNGRVSLVEGSVDIGGSRTAVSQMFAETLGLSADDIVPSVGDTDSVGYTSNSGGSGVAFKTGWVAFETANDVKRQMIERAAMVWETDVSQVEYADGGLQHKTDGDLRMSFQEMAAMMPQTGGPVVGRANMNPGGPAGSYSSNIADVAIDLETGKVDILRYTAIQDVGTAVYPAIVEGQIQGGAVQGIGWALNEEYYMNDGKMQNVSLLDYRMPTALDLPMIESVIIEVPNPNHPFGVKGVGEANIVPPLATLGNAVSRAIGKRMYSLPMNPQAVRDVIDS